jgi:hypothetical protein
MNDDTCRAQTKSPYGFFKDLRGDKNFFSCIGSDNPWNSHAVSSMKFSILLPILAVLRRTMRKEY